MLFYVTGREMKEVGHFDQFDVNGFVWDDIVVLLLVPDDAHSDRKWRRGVAKRGASGPDIGPVLTWEKRSRLAVLKTALVNSCC